MSGAITVAGPLGSTVQPIPGSIRGPMIARTRLLRSALALAVAAPLSAQSAPPPSFVVDGLRHLPLFDGRVTCLVSGDFDGDHLVDLATFTRSGSGAFLRATEPGYFEVSQSIEEPARWFACAAGDFDGDGDVDVCASRQVSGTDSSTRMVLWVNQGGAFQEAPASRFPVAGGGRIDQLNVLDVDGDGDLDLATDRYFLINDGSATFSEGTEYASRQGGEVRSLVADLDGDGLLDVWTVDGRQAAVLLGQSGGGFVQVFRQPSVGPKRSALGDFDGDGDLDLAFALVRQTGLAPGRLWVFENRLQGGFVDRSADWLQEVPLSPDALFAADLDGDGDSDLVTTDVGRPAVLLSDGTGRFTTYRELDVPGRSIPLLVFDADGDGDQDVAAEGRLFLNDGAGRFVDANRRRIPSDLEGATQIVAADLDGDGAEDLLLQRWDGLTILRNADPGPFERSSLDVAVLYPGFHQSSRSTVVDFDADGALDLAVPVSGLGTRLLRNTGNLQFMDVTAGRIPDDEPYGGTNAVVFGDFDGDGDVDAVESEQRRYIRLLRNDGTGVFQAEQIFESSSTGVDLLAGDVDGDGDLDVVHQPRIARSGLLWNDGTGRFTEAVVASWLSQTVQALVDIDADGDLDVVARGASLPASATLYRNLDGTSFDAGTPLGLEAVTQVAAGDFDADGDVDLVLTQSFGLESSVARLLLNDGTGRFEPTPEELIESTVDPGVWGSLDADGDGDLDLVRSVSGETLLFVNRLRQLRSLRLGRPGRSLEYRFANAATGVPTLVITRFAAGLADPGLPLPFFGVFRLDPFTMIDGPEVILPDPGGEVARTLPLPADRALVGAEVFCQALLVSGSDLSEWRLTNVVANEIVGN